MYLFDIWYFNKCIIVIFPGNYMIFDLHLQDAIECTNGMESSKLLHIFVVRALELFLERSAQSRKMTGNLMHDLVERNVLTVDQYLIG